MSTATNTIQVDTWDSLEGEEDMAKGHEPSWDALISHMSEDNLAGKKVLDFGCNRGGFLTRLYKSKPFESALGVDIAQDSVAFANQNKGDAPCEYDHVDVLDSASNEYDVVFSHEVIYLLPDLKAHASDMHKVLKSGGVYYLAIGEYEENPLWDRWKDIVAEFSPVPPQTYSLKYIAQCFQECGFDISVRQLVCEGFFPYDPDDRYIENPMELINFMTKDMMLFRLEKK
jgi:SAM-dependent methyltransferase